jgi:hypothetical protein
MQFPSICSVLLYGRQKEHGERTAAPPVDGTLQLEEDFVGFIPYLGGLVRLGVVCLGLGAFAGQLYRASRPVMTA